MKKVLITGGSGFVGSFIVEESLRRGYETYVCVRKNSPRVYLEDPRITLLSLDEGGIASIVNACTKFDYVVHCAGVTKAKRKEAYFRNNVEFTRALCEALKRSGKLPEKLMLVSSLAASGPGDPKSMKPRRPEDQPQPVSVYGRSKLLAEELVIASKIPHLIIRPTGVYGPRDRDFLKVFRLIKKHLELYIGFRKQSLSFLYVKDLARVIFDLLESRHINKTYFASDDRAYAETAFPFFIKKHLQIRHTFSFRIPGMLFRLMAAISGWTDHFRKQAGILSLQKVPELEALNWNVDISELKKDVGYKPEYDLDAGVRETAAWYRNAGWI